MPRYRGPCTGQAAFDVEWVQHELGGLQGRKSLLRRAGEATRETAVLGGVGDDPRKELTGMVERESYLLGLGRRRDRDVLITSKLRFILGVSPQAGLYLTCSSGGAISLTRTPW